MGRAEGHPSAAREGTPGAAAVRGSAREGGRERRAAARLDTRMRAITRNGASGSQPDGLRTGPRRLPDRPLESGTIGAESAGASPFSVADRRVRSVVPGAILVREHRFHNRNFSASIRALLHDSPPSVTCQARYPPFQRRPPVRSPEVVAAQGDEAVRTVPGGSRRPARHGCPVPLHVFPTATEATTSRGGRRSLPAEGRRRGRGGRREEERARVHPDRAVGWRRRDRNCYREGRQTGTFAPSPSGFSGRRAPAWSRAPRRARRGG